MAGESKKRCVMCGFEINEKNKSSEHIIHNAIGGVLEDEYIYCKTCNSKYGTDQDRAFTDIFAPFVEELKIRKTRKTKGPKYEGIMYKEGNVYNVEFKSGKVWTIRDKDNKYFGRQPDSDMIFGGFKFNLENKAFITGLEKIAFNYAVHIGIYTEDMNRLFDNEKKELLKKPVVIPFVPMTPFDAIMEACAPERLFHALRLFSCGQNLYVYIELFSTFQFYVLVSDKFTEEEGENRVSNDIDVPYCNYIEKNDVPDEKTVDELTPLDYKDADIIMTQYNISQEEITEKIRNNPDYDSNDKSSNWSLICREIGRRAAHILKTRCYERDYRDVVKNIYDNADFFDIGIDALQSSCKGDMEAAKDFMEAFGFYTVYDEDCVNMSRYKRVLPDGSGYPESIYTMLNGGDIDVALYTRNKFRMLEERVKEMVSNKGKVKDI